MFPVLETERLRLREITKEDAEGIFACFSNEAVTRYYGEETLQQIEQAEKFVDFFAKSFEAKRGIRWGIEVKRTKGIIGTIGFNGWSPKHRKAEIGYEIHPDYWRKGYTTEALSKVLPYGFDVMGLSRIGAIVFIENEASNNLLIKLGFKKEGVLRENIYHNGASHDTNVYSILKNERR
ncbi:GNAT family N-acetyltransferase [Ureibacillus chungkukjangi]|uniref:GNAT family N-acetyltransferase n=1 Tax=Ureibacillus chungkukjangi TaxID=1202712 RepID=UPI00384E6D86